MYNNVNDEGQRKKRNKKCLCNKRVITLPKESFGELICFFLHIKKFNIKSYVQICMLI